MRSKGDLKRPGVGSGRLTSRPTPKKLFWVGVGNDPRGLKGRAARRPSQWLASPCPLKAFAHVDDGAISERSRVQFQSVGAAREPLAGQLVNRAA